VAGRNARGGSGADGGRLMAATTLRGRPHNIDGLWLRVTQAKPLDHATTCQLIRAAQRGSVQARNRLVESNMRLVVAAAQAFKRPDLLNDLVQAGVCGRSTGTGGLMRAIETFDPDRGLRFSSFAMRAIRSAMVDELGVLFGAACVTRRWLTERARVVRIRDRLEARGQDAGADAVTAALGGSIRRDRVLEILGLPADAPLSIEHGAELPAPAAEEEERFQLTAGAVSKLSDRERAVVSLYYGLNEQPPCNEHAVALRLGMKLPEVRALRTRAERRIQRAQRLTAVA
jgi:RNA polymerase sigma factor (sigma-70 family)